MENGDHVPRSLMGLIQPYRIGFGKVESVGDGEMDISSCV
jgi:hypothetical protein